MHISFQEKLNMIELLFVVFYIIIYVAATTKGARDQENKGISGLARMP